MPRSNFGRCGAFARVAKRSNSRRARNDEWPNVSACATPENAGVSASDQRTTPMASLDGIRTIDELRLENQRLFLRVDFNVPLDEAKAITNDERIRAALPTIKKAISGGARVIL